MRVFIKKNNLPRVAEYLSGVKNVNSLESRLIMENGYIKLRGVRVHNLKNIDLDIPRGKLVVISGLSGSGKSSLAFDTLFAEGERRYMQSLSSYARQFLSTMDKPDCDLIEGLSPAIAIEQKSVNKNPRSTVATVTEIYDYYRLLFARIGKVFCPVCGREISEQSVDQIVESILSMGEGEKIQLLAPVVSGKKGEHQKILKDALASGFIRARIDGVVTMLEENIKLEKQKKHTVEIIVDRIMISESAASRLTSSVETALEMGGGIITVIKQSDSKEIFFSQKNACPVCAISMPPLSERLFSFNSPLGACEECLGLGEKKEFDRALIIKDKNLSFDDGALIPFSPSSAWNRALFSAVFQEMGSTLKTPLSKLDGSQFSYLWDGEEAKIIHWDYEDKNGEKRRYSRAWTGIFRTLKRRYSEAWGEAQRKAMEKFMSSAVCEVCGGKRLRKEALAVRVAGKNIYELTSLSVEKSLSFFSSLKLSKNENEIAREILKEINSRLKFLKDVGLSYLTLERSAGSLSGGESQRIRLATQLGSNLTGVMYVLDEPSIALHQRDNEKLIKTLLSLRDAGNSVIVVEHDEDTLKAADFIVDIGPGAGVHGGEVVASGTPAEIQNVKESATAQYLSGHLKMERTHERRGGNGSFLRIEGAVEHNLKNITVTIPLGTFTCITGVSGSGKSTLLSSILYPALSNEKMRTSLPVGKYKKITGTQNIDKVINIDQSPIGRTPRSNAATYVGFFDEIRQVFALTKEAKAHGWKAGRFSFNVKGGRCEACKGSGTILIEMNFLSDVYVKCEVCGGKRYTKETLRAEYKGKTISDVLEMTVEEASEFFASFPKIRRQLETLSSVGMNYIKIGQSALTLSGGEAQRIKLASELSRASTGRTLYIMDEPTTGLHFKDIMLLLSLVNKLVEGGNTVVMIEHNLDVIMDADYIIDLGEEGGEEGGRIVAEGKPEEVAMNEISHTGRFLKAKMKSCNLL